MRNWYSQFTTLLYLLSLAQILNFGPMIDLWSHTRTNPQDACSVTVNQPKEPPASICRFNSKIVYAFVMHKPCLLQVIETIRAASELVTLSAYPEPWTTLQLSQRSSYEPLAWLMHITRISMRVRLKLRQVVASSRTPMSRRRGNGTRPAHVRLDRHVMVYANPRKG